MAPRNNTVSDVLALNRVSDVLNLIKYPSSAQLPRERVSLARSRDDMRTWEFLMDIDDFEGYDMRYMNLGLYVDTNYIIASVLEWNTGLVADGGAILKVTRIERDKIRPYKQFPGLH